MWGDTRQIVLTAQVAAIYAAILIPFKAGIPIIPGFVELRPANAIPIVASLLFGPAAAWGSGIGNVIGDCFGTLGPASVFGFLGNFFFGYVPFLLWRTRGQNFSEDVPVIRGWYRWMKYSIVCVVASAVCAGIIGWGVEWLGLLPFMILAPAIFFNNIVMGLLLGPPLLRFLYPRVQRWGLRYTDIQPPETSEQDPGLQHQDPSVALGASSSSALKRPVLEYRELTFQYPHQSTLALDHVSFSGGPGELVMVVGASGSGKSTLCYASNGLIPHLVSGDLTGSVYINGQDIQNHPVWAQSKNVGLLFQDFETQLVATTVEEELITPLELRDPPLPSVEVQERMKQALREMGLTGFLHHDPIALSGGQRQRLVMASILVQRPSLLVLDQPGSDLDPRGRRQLREAVLRLRKAGMSILWAEHDPDDLLIADRVIVLDKGQIVWEGQPEELLRFPQLMRRWGLQPLALTECFEGLGFEWLPINIEEAQGAMRAARWSLHPPSQAESSPPNDGGEKGSSESLHSPIIRVEKLCFEYEGRSVIQDLDFCVYPGDFLAILGANGSGKSTLVRLLNGLLVPNDGRIVVDGLDTRSASMSELAKRVGLVFQNPDHQIFADTVWEEVAFSAKNFGYSNEEINDRVRKALEAVGFPVEQSRIKDPFSLQKGERQRIAVASVLATRPTILIFDEPTTGLDAKDTKRMMDMIRELNELGHTIIMITHAMNLVGEYAQRCVLLKEGRIVAEGSPRTIFSQDSLIQSGSLALPPVTVFGRQWEYTFLTVEEVRRAICRTHETHMGQE